MQKPILLFGARAPLGELTKSMVAPAAPQEDIRPSAQVAPAKPRQVLLLTSRGDFDTLAKAHVETYTRKDGSVVQAHDDKRQAAAPAGPAASGGKNPRVANPSAANPKLAASHDDLARHHFGEWEKRERALGKRGKGVAAHWAAQKAHAEASNAHRLGHANADELSEKAHAVSKKADSAGDSDSGQKAAPEIDHHHKQAAADFAGWAEHPDLPDHVKQAAGEHRDRLVAAKTPEDKRKALKAAHKDLGGMHEDEDVPNHVSSNMRDRMNAIGDAVK